MVDSWIGLDIGGANLKFANGNRAGSIPFPLWLRHDQLASELSNLIQREAAAGESIAVTMTGELADCFRSRRHGVAAIVNAVTHSAGARRIQFYHSHGGWYSASEAIEHWSDVASANWHATANLTSSLLESGNGFLIDLGSTTTDIIPIRDGRPAANGDTDFDRLAKHQLLYAGVSRTPVSGICQEFELDGRTVNAAREFFATVHDALIISGDAAEQSDNTDTADHRPATIQFAAQRLARMVCSDAIGLGTNVIRAMAVQVKQRLLERIASSVANVLEANPDLPRHFVIGGQGEGLAIGLLRDKYPDAVAVGTSQVFSRPISDSLAAYAVAQLASRSPALVPNRPTIVSSRSPIAPIRVIKIGGSLLHQRFSPAAMLAWLAGQPVMNNVWLTGGGQLVESVRRWSEESPIAADEAHWMCIDLMSVTLRMVASRLAPWPVMTSLSGLASTDSPANILFDPRPMLRFQNDFSETDPLPCGWEITSDSIAAHVARQLNAAEVVLLKSCEIPDTGKLESLAQQGVVDSAFARFAASIPHVRVINLNSQAFQEVGFRPPKLR